jgi:hypothetical protein
MSSSSQLLKNTKLTVGTTLPTNKTPDGITSTWRRSPRNPDRFKNQQKSNEKIKLEKALSSATISQSFKRPRIDHQTTTKSMAASMQHLE